MAKESALTLKHLGRGARFLERDGWRLPEHFGDVTAEYHAVRNSVGILDLSHRGLLQFTGPDRLSFLQGMVSNDLRGLQTFDGQYAALLTQQGKVVADVRVLCAMNSLYLDFWEPLKEKILSHLNRYLIADEVEIADRTEEYGTFSLQGPQSTAMLRTLAGEVDLPQRLAGHTMIKIAGAAVCAVTENRGGGSGFDLIVPKSNIEEIAGRLDQAGPANAALWVGDTAQQILRIEAGIPLYGVDFDENNLLLEVGLDQAVSFNKGCYLGQEVVERIRSRGHVNKKLSGLVLENRSLVHAGDAIHKDGKLVGAVTSSVLSLSLGRVISLGYVAKEFWDPGTRLVIRSGTEEHAARVTALPFVRFS